MANLEKISKIEAATRQLSTAIELYVSGGDMVSVYALVRASEEILDKLCAHNGLPRSVMYQGISELPITEKHRNKILLKLNEPKNFFKHAGRDADKEIEWSEGVIEHFIRDCITMYKRLSPSGKLPCELEAFSVIYRIRNKDMFEQSESEEFDYNLEIIDELMKKRGLLWIYNYMIEACEVR